jgi:hypothetical protein
VIDLVAVAVVVVAAFVLSSVYYSVFGSARPGGDERPKPGVTLIELARSVVLALTLAWFAGQQGITTLGGGLLLALVAWIGFPAVLLTGSVVWDKVSWRVAALHGGDWLVKIFMMAAVLSVWR